MKKIVRLTSLFITFSVILILGVSFYTDYKTQKVMTKSGIKVTVDTDGCNTSVTNLDGKLIEVKDTYDSYWFKNGWRVKVTATAHEGKTFEGWYANGVKVSSSSTYTHTVTGEVKLVAKATANNYTITCNLDGGNVNGQTSWSTTYTINDTVTLPTPKKTGHTLIGWVEDETGAQYEVGHTIKNGSTGNKTFTAKYRKNILSIKYNANGGQVQPTEHNFTQDSNGNILRNGKVYVQTLAYGDTLSNGLHDWNNKNSMNIYKDFYYAKGSEQWYADINGQRKYFAHNINYSPADFIDISNGDATVTVYVNWTETKLFVRLWSDGGAKWQDETTNKILSIPTDRYFKTVELISTGMTPSYVIADPLRLSGRDYYTIKDRQSWYYTNSSGNEIALDVGGTSAVTTKSIATKLGVLGQLKRDRVFVDLHPKWRKNIVTVQYNVNGGKLVSPTNSKYSSDSSGNVLKDGNPNVQVVAHGESLFPEQSNNGFLDWNNQDGHGIAVQYENKIKMAKEGAEWNTKPDGTGTSFNDHIGYTADDVADLKDGDKILKVYVNWVDSYVLDTDVLLNESETKGGTSLYVDYDVKITVDGKVKTLTGLTGAAIGEYKPFSYEISNIRGNDKYKYVGDSIIKGTISTTGATTVKLSVSEIYTNTIYYLLSGVKEEDGGQEKDNSKIIEEKKFKVAYGEWFYINKDLLYEPPEGLTVNTRYFTRKELTPGLVRLYDFGTGFEQGNWSQEIYFTYYATEYKIHYSNTIDSAVINPNPDTYNVLYGVKFKDPSKKNRKFDGYYKTLANGSEQRVYGINIGKTYENVTTFEQLRKMIEGRQVGDVYLETKWLYQKAKMCDAMTWDAYVGTHIRYSYDDFKIYINERPKVSSSASTTYDVSENQDGSVIAEITWESPYSSIYVYGSDNQQVVLPTNMNDYFTLADPDIGSKVVHIGFYEPDYGLVESASRLFGSGYVKSIVLSGYNKGFYGESMFLDFNPSECTITVDKLFRFNGYLYTYNIGLSGSWLDTKSGVVYTNFLPDEVYSTFQLQSSYSLSSKVTEASDVSEKSQDSNILDITDAPVPEVENISQDTVETEESTEPESDIPISDVLAEEQNEQEGGIENEG